ncbi:MAG TPA: metallophosphoesterase [Polyangia bacterium]|nr:metallophosphoesterase [Polyangia bacterium]
MASIRAYRLVCLCCLLAPACGGASSPSLAPAPTVKLMVFSDPHYYDPSLGTTGAAFDSYVAHDRKLVAESDAVLRALVSAVNAENPDVVLIPGDLSKDGEQTSHGLVANYLGQMKRQGRRVFVVPGNHDIQNPGAASYSGDTTTPVPSITPADFSTIYQDFGFGDAISIDPDSLSYVAELLPGLWLLALDSCIYGPNPGDSQVAGRLRDTTQTWIKARLDQAKASQIRVIGMMHHGVIEHFASQALVFPEYLVNDRAAIAGLFSDGGMGAVFTGHFHANDITQGTPTGSSQSLFDIETGSAVTYPCPYRIVDVAGDTLAVTTQHITSIDYDLQGATDFQNYAHDKLLAGLDQYIAALITAPPYSIAADQAQQISPWMAEGLVAHYAGDELMPSDMRANIQSLYTATDYPTKLAGMLLQSVWTDLPPPDNNVALDLATR